VRDKTFSFQTVKRLVGKKGIAGGENFSLLNSFLINALELSHDLLKGRADIQELPFSP
jgi:hypothetical protein